jgi:hypothetical protein
LEHQEWVVPVELQAAAVEAAAVEVAAPDKSKLQ